MLYNEFAERTGFYPTEEHYRQVEEVYSRSHHPDKDVFCKAFLTNADGLASKTAAMADDAVRRRLEEKEAVIRSLTGELERTRKVLEETCRDADAFREWKMVDFEEAHGFDLGHVLGIQSKMTDVEAVNWIASEFGFQREQIRIHHMAHDIEKDRFGYLRAAEKCYEIVPAYEATDFNFVCFSVCGHTFVCIDGELKIVDALGIE